MWERPIRPISAIASATPLAITSNPAIASQVRRVRGGGGGALEPCDGLDILVERIEPSR